MNRNEIYRDRSESVYFQWKSHCVQSGLGDHGILNGTSHIGLYDCLNIMTDLGRLVMPEVESSVHVSAVPTRKDTVLEQVAKKNTTYVFIIATYTTGYSFFIKEQ